MWAKKLDLSMTEQSGQQPSPAETLRKTLEQQHTLIQNHDAALRELNNRQAETNRRLEEIASYLQGTSSQASAVAPAPAPVPDPQSTSRSVDSVRSTVSDFRPSLPERFSGEVSKCRGFLFQCTIIFNHSPQSFLHDGRKISFILSHLSGKALEWAEARFPNSADYGYSFDDFLDEFKQAFNQDTDKTSDSRSLLELKQGRRSVAEFAIDFRIKAAASGWGQTALKSAYFHALNDSIKDELAVLDEPKTLEELINLTIRLDNRLRSRNRERAKSCHPFVRSCSDKTSNSAFPSSEPAETEPMQIGSTRLSPEERLRRFKENLCLYCGESGHRISTCPSKAKAVVRQRK
uniref:CCHC-type domain-containing protein n=1 Tax=Xiphophorus couchianus TaxID=32473 RepID=A0A3B5KXT1_9TELE